MFMVVPISFSSTFLFQGFGRESISLILTFLCEIVGYVIMPIIIATVFGFGIIRV